MKTLYLILVIALGSACADHRVRCSGRLEPINPPAAVAAERAAAPAAPLPR